MRVDEIDGKVFFSIQRDNENQMMIEKTTVKYIMDMCNVEDMSITVKADFNDMRRALWDGMHHAVIAKDEKVCGDIVRCMEYINGMEMKSDESV